MKELNDVQRYIDDDFLDVSDVSSVNLRNSTLLNINIAQRTDSGILLDPEESKSYSKFSINSHESSRYQIFMKGKNFHDADSIPKFSSIRELHSKQSLLRYSVKSSSVSTMTVPLQESRSSTKIRNKRFSLPDIDKLNHYHEDKSGKKSLLTRKSNQCDIKLETQSSIPRVPTEANALLTTVKELDNFSIDPKLINKNDGLSQSLYYIDENGSPKIRERYIKQQRQMIDKQEQKRRDKEARKENDAIRSCSCFNFSRFSKKLKELCK